MLFTVFHLNKKGFQIFDHRNIKFFGQDILNIVLKTCWGIEKVEKYHLVLKIAILDLKCYLLFVAFLDSYLVIGAH